MTKKQKRMLKKILISAAAYLLWILCNMWLSIPEWLTLSVYLVIYVYLGWNILKKAAENIGKKQMMDENFLMAVASLGAFILGEHIEAIAVVLFYQIGEWFQSYAVERSRRSISALMDIRPDYANIEKDGKLEQADPEEVEVGQTIVIQPGERVPLDGVVLDGDSALDTSALTGESVPRMVHPGSDVISGCINESGLLHVRVTKAFQDSTVSRILEMVENATDRKAPAEQFITRFARYYTPIVVYTALALMLIPSLMTGDWNAWIYRGLEFLVISCPCALVVSVPLAFFGGIGGASKCGILVKGSTYLEAFSNVNTIVFDKTGTLTKGTFKVTGVFPDENSHLDTGELLRLAALAESRSTHPIARSIEQAAGSINSAAVKDIHEIAGHGVEAEVDGRKIGAGNLKLMRQEGITEELPAGNGFGTVVYLSVDGKYAGMIEISDEVKADAKTAIDLLRNYGVKKFVMLTGDSKTVAAAVAGSLGIDEVHSELLPQDKVKYVDELLAKQGPKEKLAFVGDGINDAPVLTMADVGVAMGALGSDAAIEAADIVLMDDDLYSLVTAKKIARKTMNVSWANIIFAIVVKIAVLILSALGLVGMWWAVFADVGVSVIAILNSMRLLRVKQYQKDSLNSAVSNGVKA